MNHRPLNRGLAERHYAAPQLLALLLTLLLGSLYLWSMLDRGWVPHDEGALAHSAERVLQGEVPHRDFDDIYTGALSYLNALAFAWFGAKLTSLRYMLFGFSVLWLLVLFYAFSRFVGAAVSAGLTLLALSWSVPNYAAAIPSWYNLFFATAGMAALLRYLESHRQLWIVAAGFCAGLSCLFKIVGLYFVAASLLFLLFVEQTEARPSAISTRLGHRLFGLFVWLGMALFVLCLGLLVSSRFSFENAVHFVFPGIVIAGVVSVLELRLTPASAWDRFRSLWRRLRSYLAGFAVPVLGFAAYYVAQGALSDLGSGVFLRPLKRVDFAAVDPAPIVTLVPAALLLLLGIALVRVGGSVLRIGIAVVTLLLATVLLTPWSSSGYLLAWYSISQAAPLLVLLGGGMLVLFSLSAMPGDRKQVLDMRRLFLVLATLGMCALVQYPFAAPIYFAYVAPFVILAVTAVASPYAHIGASLFSVVGCFYFLFAVFRMTPAFIYDIGVRYRPDGQRHLVLPERAGLKISATDAAQYEALVKQVQVRARGEFMYATPDSPEVYFLTGLRNPTRTLFDFFDVPEQRTERILGAITTHGINVVAVNRQPGFSGEIPADLADSLVSRFPNASTIGRFTVRWRE